MLQHLTIEFDHSVNTVKNIITFDGFIRLGWKNHQREILPAKANEKTLGANSVQKTFPHDSRYGLPDFLMGPELEDLSALYDLNRMLLGIWNVQSSACTYDRSMDRSCECLWKKMIGKPYSGAKLYRR